MTTVTTIIIITVISIYIVYCHLTDTSFISEIDENETEYETDTQPPNNYADEMIKQLKQQNNNLHQLKNNIGCLTFIIFILVILYIAPRLLSVIVGYNILEEFYDIYQNLPQ